MRSNPDASSVVVYTDGGYLPHNLSSRYGHGGWAWWVSLDTHASGPYLNAESSDHVERLAVERALTAFADDARHLLVVCDNLAVVSRVQRALKGDTAERDAGWETLAAMVRQRGRERLSVLHTHGHGRGVAAHRRGNAEADRLATKARKAAARTVSSIA
jgi:ribonuclease HI